MRLLAGLLAAPEDDSLSVLTELAREHAWLREPVVELADVGLPYWQTEHTGLFISNYPKTICPPFESAYRSGNMEGVAAQELTELYLRIDLEAEDVPADYLGTILECAAYLLEMPEPPDDALWRELWEQHVVSWVPRFVDDILGMKNCLLLYHQLAHQLLLSISTDKSSSGKPAP
uniref:Chaperone TorD involved in molybdoenzyme TorA maturation n=1 Tax=Candidatus Kentrum sp. FM TaxID=2126340 RepID=A0A450SHP1_9GAMM|nr:MAG: chaperone TorD involved in molybdoenzyme TorA maturation [Candidatus Kentron sp. FM]VFJ54895.1 MAG: chaperone TorD involved in molybdoenzyme TorA maturation [Candidatus Kentron sp. FM]VFK09660.1 MAG: chaperone TorD involved in molybdoenzyme TorA maturation [Candidatus Kentron sp. FM]